MIMLQDNIVSNRIRSQRKEKNMTQKDLATAVNVSPQVVSNWERGYTPEIGNDDLLSLSIALGVTTDYLLGIVDHPCIMTMKSIIIQNENDKYQLKVDKNSISEELISPQLSPDELALIEKYRRMKDNEKDTMHKVADTIAPDEQAAAVGK